MSLDHEGREGGAERWDLADGENLQNDELVCSAFLGEHTFQASWMLLPNFLIASNDCNDITRLPGVAFLFTLPCHLTSQLSI